MRCGERSYQVLARAYESPMSYDRGGESPTRKITGTLRNRTYAWLASFLNIFDSEEKSRGPRSLLHIF